MNCHFTASTGITAAATTTQAWKRCMTMIRQCKSMRQLKSIHALFVTHGFTDNTYATSQLLNYCAQSGNLSYASRLFAHFPSAPNAYFYNTLIRAYSQNHHPHTSLQYFNLMLKNSTVATPDQHTFPFVLISCAEGSWMNEGTKIHCWVLKNGLVFSDRYVQTALMRFYSACSGGGNLADTRKVFDEITQPDLVQWNVLMNSYLKLGLGCEALDVFREMLVSKINPDDFCLTTAITACSQLGSISQGKWIHEYLKKKGTTTLLSDVFIGTALVGMYAKCGSINMALEVFRNMPERNRFSWAAMIGGLAVHGRAKEAIGCLDEMWLADGIRPDGVVLLGVLNACNHSGLQQEGVFLLENMEEKYGVVPEHEHYSCVVDLLCRAGKLDDSVGIIRRMPMKPRASVWGALLSGCRIHRNIELAEIAVKELEMLGEMRDEEGFVEDGEDGGGTYVQLSNIYLDSQRQESASKIRRIIGEKRMKKTPGGSLIETDGRLSEFVSSDVSHPCTVDIRLMLGLIYHELFRCQSNETHKFLSTSSCIPD